MKFGKRKKRAKRLTKPLDRFSQKRRSGRRKAVQREPVAKVRDPYAAKKPRGRPPKIPPEWVTGRAHNHRIQLSQMWETLEGSLLQARTVEEVTSAFHEHGRQYADEFVSGFAADILALIRDPKFPKRGEARINFLADSLGGRPSLTFRSSRDVCEGERTRQRKKSPHYIIRKEYYVECSCGYKGPARDNACRKCGAEISFSFQEMMAGGLF